MPPLGRSPHEDLPFEQISFRHFVRHAQVLLQAGNVAAFIQFVLCGRKIMQDGTQSRVIVNARQGASAPNMALDTCQITRDLDSIIGISRNLPYTAPLALYPLPPFRDTLKKSNKFTYDLRQHDVLSTPTFSYAGSF